MKMILLLVTMLVFLGCSKADGSKKAGQKGKSTVQTMIDGVTGRTAVRAGEKAKAEIRRISEQKQSNLAEVLGE